MLAIRDWFGFRVVFRKGGEKSIITATTRKKKTPEAIERRFVIVFVEGKSELFVHFFLLDRDVKQVYPSCSVAYRSGLVIERVTAGLSRADCGL